MRSLSNLHPRLCNSLCAAVWLACGFGVDAAPVSVSEPIAMVGKTRLYVDYSARPDPRALRAHDFCILDPAANVDLSPGRTLGHTQLAYVSAVEVAQKTDGAGRAATRGIPTIARNEAWNSSALDVTHPAWSDWLVDDMVGPALAKGYDGVFLDTLDSAETIGLADPTKKKAVHDALVAGVRRLHERFPGKRVVINRGFPLLDEVADAIDGVLVESLYQTSAPGTQTYSAVSEEGSQWLLQHIERIKSKGLPVFVVDYVAPGDAALAHATAQRITGQGCIPFITTPALKGESLAPLREVPRRILVLHGWAQEDENRPAFPADTLTAALLQMPLEWLGCEVEFFDAGKGTPPELSPVRYRGVLLDEALHLPLEQEDAFADWLLAQQQRGVKILFTGSIPFTRPHVVARVFRSLGLGGDYVPARLQEQPSIAVIDEAMMKAETPVEPSVRDFRPITAPNGARVLLGLQGQDVAGRSLRYEPVFLAGWGGALLQPYVMLYGLPNQTFCYVDIYAFLEAWLATGPPFPAPDTTTRDGLRLFYSHIDGDGFVSRSALAGNPICGEAIRDHILRPYPLPVTVSVIEAEVEAHLVGLESSNVPRFRDAARSIFAMPNVQAASHAYSHPFRWLDVDPGDETKYPTRNLVLQPWANYTEDLSMDREVRGSVEYINRTLLPPDKRVELFLWSGNCRPGAEALRICREMGVENMNGGTTVLSRLYPGISSVAPRHTFWDDEMQVFAANQNEFMYANGWLGPFFGGFANLIDTFERTGSPRRLKPVNVYYHFYSATYLSSLRALEKILNWCMEQPLHAVTAKQYAAAVRDAYDTRIYEAGAKHWILSNAGDLRTLRLPAGAGFPDMARSKGLTGYIRDGDALYIHTRGEPVVEVVLTGQPVPHLHLASCTAEVLFKTLTADKADFSVQDLRPVRATFSGIPAMAKCDVLVNDQPIRLQADAEGILTLNLPPAAKVALDFAAPNYASRN